MYTTKYTTLRQADYISSWQIFDLEHWRKGLMKWVNLIAVENIQIGSILQSISIVEKHAQMLK